MRLPQRKLFETVFVCGDKKYLHARPVPAEEARTLIQELLHVRQSGLQKPIPFFPNSSFAYFQKIKSAGLSRDSTDEQTDLAKRNTYRKPRNHGRASTLKAGESLEKGKTFPTKPVLGNLPLLKSGFLN